MASPKYTVTVTMLSTTPRAIFDFRGKTRGPNFSGQVYMLGLIVDDRPLMRAYSIASANWDEELEFYSIIIQDGALTPRLQHIQVGTSRLSAKAVEPLQPEESQPVERLFMLSTGTGFAPLHH